MSPEYLEQLADLADPRQLWRVAVLSREAFTEAERHQLDTGVALRRHASHIRRLREVLKDGRSLLITPLSDNGSAIKAIDTPADHARLRREQGPFGVPEGLKNG